MKKRITTLIIVISIAAYAAPESRLTWEPVSEARGYYIEIRDSKGKFIVRENISRNYYDVSKLEPGRYSFRIATVNIAKEKGESTGWITFVIEKRVPPGLKKVSPSEIMISDTVNEIRIKGENFNSGTRFFLRRGKDEIQIRNVRILSENEALISFKSEQAMKGFYDLTVVNKGGAKDVLANAVNIVETEKRKTRFFAAAGYDMNTPRGDWAGYFSPSYMGGSISMQMSAGKYGYKNILLETGISGAFYSNTSSTRKSSLIILSSGVGGGYYYPAKENLNIFLKVTAGPAYSVLTLDESTAGGKTTSIDLFVKPAAGVRYYAGDRFFIEPSINWNTIFMSELFFHSWGISIYAGIVF